MTSHPPPRLQISSPELPPGEVGRESAPGPEPAAQTARTAALAALDAGELVVIPTETVYGVAAREDRPAALEKLSALKGQRQAPYSLAVSGVDRIAERLQPLRGPALRVAERWWPGPITQVLPTVSALEGTAHGPALGVRVVGHRWTRSLLAECASPLVLPSANLSGRPAPLSVDELEPGLLEQVALVIDGGRCALGESSTVLRPSAAGMEILREGVVNREDLRRHALGNVLVVCSGNTCRSPMASLLLGRALARQVEGVPAFLPPEVHSAGTWAGHGAPASSGALEAMARRNLELGSHRSQPLAHELLETCDLVLCMTESHLAAVLEASSALGGPAVELFDPDGEEVLDPYGGSREVYAQCAQQLESMAQRRAEMLCPSPAGTPT